MSFRFVDNDVKYACDACENCSKIERLSGRVEYMCHNFSDREITKFGGLPVAKCSAFRKKNQMSLMTMESIGYVLRKVRGKVVFVSPDDLSDNDKRLKLSGFMRDLED